MKLHLLITFCLLNILVECKWRSYGEFDQEEPNQINRENNFPRGHYRNKGHHHKRSHCQEEFDDDNEFHNNDDRQKVYHLDKVYHHGKDYHHGKELPEVRDYHSRKEFKNDNEYHGNNDYREQRHYRKAYRDQANEISNVQSDRDSVIPDPPDHTKLVQMARYVLHNSDWASVATISVLPSIEGFPFSNVKSVVDGSIANSTGVPYFYMSPLDFTAKDLARNSHATILVSLEETRYCERKKYDPEDPRCTRLMLSGKMKRLKEGTPEYKFAKDALFERHPAMADFPPDHDWFVAKMKIAQVAMVDWFGGAKFVPVKDYLAYNYTGDELGKNDNDVRKNLPNEYVTVV